MDVSILLLVIKARGQHCLAQLCPGGGAGHSPDVPPLPPRCSGQQLAPSTQWAGDRQLHTPLHIPGWEQAQ